MPARRQPREQIRQINVLKRKLPIAKLLAPVRRRLEILPWPVSAELVVGSTLFRTLEGLVRFGDFLEFLLPGGILGNVRMVLVRELAVRLLDLLTARVSVNAQNGVVVLVFHR